MSEGKGEFFQAVAEKVNGAREAWPKAWDSIVNHVTNDRVLPLVSETFKFMANLVDGGDSGKQTTDFVKKYLDAPGVLGVAVNKLIRGYREKTENPRASNIVSYDEWQAMLESSASNNSPKAATAS